MVFHSNPRVSAPNPYQLLDDLCLNSQEVPLDEKPLLKDQAVNSVSPAPAVWLCYTQWLKYSPMYVDNVLE